MIRFMDGNEAVVEGALAAGCDFFAGYPITPATSILTGMIRKLPAAGGVAVQAEDEISAIGFCIGAVMAGRKALTATSGPGISLYSENIGLAIAGETPLVIVDVQRQGPATGSATMGAQGDIQFVRWVTSGGYPTIALAPTSAEECFRLTHRAFELAETYRVPVFLMLDKEIGLTRERVDLSLYEGLKPVTRRLAEPEGPFLPYDFDRSEEVPPMSCFGGPHILRYTTSMHDKTGYLTKDREKISMMMDHLESKILTGVDDFGEVQTEGPADAGTVVLAFGNTARSAREAVRRAAERGESLKCVTIVTLWPFPEQALREACGDAERIVVAEQNLGEYVLEVRRAFPDRDVRLVRRVDGRPIPPGAILEEAVRS
jgi:2-oxoglutarate ferredoxin oxidoreductase subunit alpha